MEKLLYIQTENTPYVNFEINGFLEIKGKSIPENGYTFFKKIFDWIDEYSKNPKSETILNIQLDYFNSATSKCLITIFKKLENIFNNNNNVMIRWFYKKDDEEIFEAGKDFKSIVKIPFEIIEITQN